MTFASPCMMLSGFRSVLIRRFWQRFFCGATRRQRRKPEIQGTSGRSHRKLLSTCEISLGMTVRASGPAGLSAGAERLVHDALDRPRATSAFRTATKASVDLL